MLTHEQIDRYEDRVRSFIGEEKPKPLADAARQFLKQANDRGSQGAHPDVVHLYRSLGIACQIASGIAALRSMGVEDPSAIDDNEVLEHFGAAHCYLIDLGVMRND